MANIRVIGGDILLVGGAICVNDECCCPKSIDDLIGSSIRITFTNTACCPNELNDYCVDADWCPFNDSFILLWNSGVQEWRYSDDYRLIVVYSLGSNLIKVHAFVYKSGGPPPQDWAYLFSVSSYECNTLPCGTDNELVSGDCGDASIPRAPTLGEYDASLAAQVYICGYGGEFEIDEV